MQLENEQYKDTSKAHVSKLTPGHLLQPYVQPNLDLDLNVPETLRKGSKTAPGLSFDA